MKKSFALSPPWFVPGCLLVAGFIVALGQSTNDPATKASRSLRYYSEISNAPGKAQGRPNPFEGNPNALAAGRKLFELRCAECHGASAEGTRKAPSLRAPQVRDAAPGALFWVLTNGVVRRGMPVWSKLPEQQRWQIVAYLKGLK
jgi:mono/diheme cytochrome c family protein